MKQGGLADAVGGSRDELLQVQQRSASVARRRHVWALHTGGDAAAAVSSLVEVGSWLAGGDAARARFLLWQATHDRAHLAEAKRLLDFMVEHAPAECRESMLTNVRVHREIVAACKEQGL